MNYRRHRIPYHFTASGLVLANEHVLLVYHKRIGAWVPPGGHVEAHEFPCEAVVREIREETGILVEIVSDLYPETGDPDAFFLLSPLYFQSVKAIENSQELYHLDLAYLCKLSSCYSLSSYSPRAEAANALPSLKTNSEVKEARWIPLCELHKFPLAKNVHLALGLAQEKLQAQQKLGR